MSVENDIVQRIASPLSSGRSSPINAKARQKDDDNLLKRDKGYRRYASTVERVLAQFDTAVEEWADYISFLGRLLKALSIKPSGFADIPHKTHVAKRLSQCLNPKLPSGVHQKTLEVYAYIFSTLGRDGLSADLGLYLPGLTPILSFAALSVKPNVLAIFESHIVPLQSSAIRPALKSLLLALLPGLEEENSEEFDRTLRILQALKGSIARDQAASVDGEESYSDQYFWQCMFLACITSTTRRPGGLAYLIRYLPNLGNSPLSNGTGATTNGDSSNSNHQTRLQEAIDSVVSPEPGLLIRCFCAGLQDLQPLIQRGFLDLLVTRLPLNSVVLQEKVVPADLEKVVIAATSVVARKDMSLNRRLWSWFLGPEPSSEPNGTSNGPTSPQAADVLSPTQNIMLYQTRHFERYGLKPLVQGILSMIAKDPKSHVDRTKPLRISLSLMDRREIGSSVIPRIFLPAMQSVWTYQSAQATEESKSEVLKSANAFFDGVESSLIWSELSGVLSKALDPRNLSTSGAHNMLQMVNFMVHNFDIREEEMQLVHIPLALLMIIFQLLRLLNGSSSAAILGPESSVSYALRIANRILELTLPRAFTSDKETTDQQALSVPLASDKFLQGIENFYSKHNGQVNVAPPFTQLQIGQALLETACALVTSLVTFNASRSNLELDSAVSLLVAAIRKGPNFKPDLDPLFSTLAGENGRYSQEATKPFAITAAKVSVLEAICSSNHSYSWLDAQQSNKIFPALLHEVWHALSPSRPKYNVEAVRCIWRLYSISFDRQIITSSIVTLMVENRLDSLESTMEAENARKFFTIWSHTPSTNTSVQGRRSSLVSLRADRDTDSKLADEMSLLERPLMLLLDTLDEPTCSLSPLVVNWLQSLSTLMPIFNVLISRLAMVRPVLVVFSTIQESTELGLEEDPDGLQTCLYYLRTIHNVIEQSHTNVWPALAAPSSAEENVQDVPSLQDRLTQICVKIVQGRNDFRSFKTETQYQLYQTALALIKQFYNGPLSKSIAEKKLEDPLIEELIKSVEAGEQSLQTSLMEVILAALRSRQVKETPPKTPKHQRNSSREIPKSTPSLSIAAESNDPKSPARPPVQLPARLLESIVLGLKAPSSRPILESWTTFLSQCLPLYEDHVFQVLLPLVGCFCNTLDSLLEHMRGAYQNPEAQVTEVLDPTVALLLNGLEQSLATAHDVLTTNEVSIAPVKSPEPQPSSFFGNMVSGVFATDAKIPKTLTANNRLTVLLCFKDAMRICFSFWSWGDTSKESSLEDSSAWASFNYITLRLRNRTRRIFEHLFAAEALECLESLIELWHRSPLHKTPLSTAPIFDLLSALESSRPKIIMPAIFNAIYSRTNPAALDPSRKSTLTSSLSDIVSASFLVAYVQSLDDDAMDEIWNDCVTFLKDVLANPMPHRQILPRLIEFTAVLGEKVDNTTFGEQRRIRRELGDLFVRLLTATLTIRPMGVSQEATSGNERQSADGSTDPKPSLDLKPATGAEGLIFVLAAIIPNLSKVLVDSERLASATNIISNQVLLPVFRSKAFPENVNQHTLELVQALSSISEASKSVKRDVGEAFNDSKIFFTPVSLAQTKWLPILRSWSLGDKERMPELLSRLSSPASAGVLGIGATSARTEADRKTQLNLRRIALLILAAAEDTYVVNLTTLQDKLVDLLNATATSSPSATTRAEIYMVFRALVLKISPVHLAPLWPTINSELFDAISTAYPTSSDSAPSSETLSPTCLLQACKLLDTLLTLELDEFQMQEWLFISDTTDAVYRPPHLLSVALVDDLTEALDEQKSQASGHLATDTSTEKRKPLLTKKLIEGVPREKMMDKVLRPFFRQLSIHAFESTYGMQAPDWEACLGEVLGDLFDDGTLV